MRIMRWIVALTLVISSGCAGKDETLNTEQAGSPTPPPAATLAAATDQFLTAGDTRLRYRVAGSSSATPIVVIHGYTRTMEDWFGFTDSLALTHRVIAFDARGFGKSSKSGDVARFGARMSDDVLALLDSLGIERAHLVGYSMGALIAGDVATRFPQRVASASLISGPFYADSVVFTRETRNWVRDLESGRGLRNFIPWLFPGTPDSVAVGMSAEAMAANDSASMVATMKGFPGLTVTASEAKASATPAFITVGGKDPLAPLSRALARQWPRATFVEVADANHQTILGAPEVMAGIRGVLTTADVPSPRRPQE